MIYTYECRNCGHVYTESRSVKDRHDVACPQCNNTDDQEIILHAVIGKMKRNVGRVGYVDPALELGPGWRETEGSKRILRGERVSGREYFYDRKK